MGPFDGRRYEVRSVTEPFITAFCVAQRGHTETKKFLFVYMFFSYSNVLLLPAYNRRSRRASNKALSAYDRRIAICT